MHRKGICVLLSRETLLLCGSNDLTVDQQCCCRIVIEGRNAQDFFQGNLDFIVLCTSG